MRQTTSNSIRIIVDVLLGRCFEPKAFHQQLFISPIEKLIGELLTIGNQSPHFAVMLWAVGENEEFVSGVEVDESPTTLPLL